MVTLFVEGTFDELVVRTLINHLNLSNETYNIFPICEESKEERVQRVRDALINNTDKIAVIVDSDFVEKLSISELTADSELQIKNAFWDSLNDVDGFVSGDYESQPFHIVGYEHEGKTLVGEMECLIIPKNLYALVNTCTESYENCIGEKLKQFQGGSTLPPFYHEFFKAPIPYKNSISNTGFDGKLKKRLTRFIEYLEKHRTDSLGALFNISTFDRLKNFLTSTIE